MNLGRVIKNAREKSNLSQKEFARRLGLTPAALWKIETGRTFPKQTTISRFLTEAHYSMARLYIEALEPSDYKEAPE